MALALSPEESLKYRIADGKYQKFLAWMGNALMGRINATTMLVLEAASTDLAVLFLSKCLPGVRVATRFRRDQDFKNHVLIFREVYPRRSRQRDRVCAMMARSNVILVNPPTFFSEHTTLPIFRVNMMIDTDAVDLAATFASLIVKFHVFSNVDAIVDMNDALAEKSPTRSFQDLARSYRRSNTPMRNVLALAQVAGADARIDFKNQTIHARPFGASSVLTDVLTVPQFVVEFYDKGSAMIQWISRCAVGIPALNMVMVVEDSTDTTIEMVRKTFGNQRVAYLSDANISSLHYISDTSYYVLYVFDRLTLPLLDLATICKYSSVMIIDQGHAYVHYDPRVYALRAKYLGALSGEAFPIESRLSCDGFFAYAREAYDATIKEPACIVYLEKALMSGRYKWNQDVSIDDIVLDYTAWCALQNVPPWVYLDIGGTRRTLSTVVNTYFRCSLNDAYVRFTGSRKVIVG